MRIVPVGAIREESILGKTIYNEGGHILLKAGVVLTESLIKRLTDNNIISVYIDDDYSVGEIYDVISPELRNKANVEIRSVFKGIQEVVQKELDSMRNDPNSLKKRLSKVVDLKYFEKVSEVVEEVLDELIRNREAMCGLVDIKSTNQYLYQHSVQVTVLALMLGISLKFNKRDLRNLAIGAMLHDIGLSFLDSSYQIYKDSFSDEEKKEYEQHTVLGYNFLKENTSLGLQAMISVVQHHERYNGKGYPYGIKGDKIHLFSRIIAIADTYDKMTSGVEGEHVFPNEALEYILGNSGEDRKFDLDLSIIFFRRIIAYPLGTYVNLSNGYNGVVIENHSQHPLRPTVQVVIEGVNISQLPILNLVESENYNITITKVVYDFE